MSRNPANTPPSMDDDDAPEAAVAAAPVPPPMSDIDAERLAEAEEEFAMLRRLSQLAMAICEAKAAKALAESAPPEAAAPAEPATPSRRDPAESFMHMSRVVRLTVMLRRQVADEIADLRAGRPRPGAAKPAAAATPAAPAANAPSPDADFMPGRAPGDPVDPARWADLDLPVDHPSAHRNKLRDCVYSVINADREPVDYERLVDRLDRLYAGLIEGERYDAFIHRPFKETVAAICKDLNLDPDWSLWTGDGFPDPLAGTKVSGREGMWHPRLGPINKRRTRPRDPPAVWPDPPPRLRPWQSPYPTPT